MTHYSIHDELFSMLWFLFVCVCVGGGIFGEEISGIKGRYEEMGG